MYFKLFGVEVFVGRNFVADHRGGLEVNKTPDGVEVYLGKRYYAALSYTRGDNNGKAGSNIDPEHGTSCRGTVQD